MATPLNKLYLLGDFVLEPDTRRLTHNGAEVHLARRPFEVLLYLIENKGRLVTTEELLDKFWDGHDVYENTARKAVGAARKALDDHSDHPRFIETRWAGGYRYIGPLSQLRTADGGLRIDESDATDVVEVERVKSVRITVAEETYIAPRAWPEPRRKLSRRVWLWAAVFPLALVAALAFAFIRRPVTRPGPAPLRSLAILPLKNLTGDANQDFLGDGVTESLISLFSKYQDLKVISRTSAFAFKNKAATPQEIGRQLGVEGLLEGSVKQHGDKLYVDVRLVSVADGRVLWTSQTFARPIANAFEIQDGVACAVGAELKVRLCGESELAKSNTHNAQAYEAYLKGRFHWHKRQPEDMKAALGLFERAVKLDPNYALGYAGLADTYTVMEINNQVPPRTAAPKAREFAAKALALDDTLAGPYAALGLLASNSDWNWQEGEKLYQAALARNAGYATAHQWYGYSLMAQARFAEAEREMKRAQELDPLAYGVSNTLNELYCHARQWDKCIEQAQASLKLLPGNWNSCRLTGLSYWRKGMKAEAVKALDEGKLTLIKEILYNENRDAVRKQIEAYAKSPEAVSHPYGVAAGYAMFEDKEAAFQWLNKAYDSHQADLVTVHIEPAFDLIRDDPRYQDLLRRIGLAQ